MSNLGGGTSVETPVFVRPGKIKSLRAFILMSRQAELLSRQPAPVGTPALSKQEQYIQNLLNDYLWGAEEIFEHLSSYGFNSVWQAVSAYVRKGNALSVTASVGADITLPCFEVGLAASAGIKAEVNRYGLTLIQNLPGTINYKIYSQTARLYTTDQIPRWP